MLKKKFEWLGELVGKAMRYTSAEKVEIKRLVEESDLSVKRTLDGFVIYLFLKRMWINLPGSWLHM